MWDDPVCRFREDITLLAMSDGPADDGTLNYVPGLARGGCRKSSVFVGEQSGANNV